MKNARREKVAFMDVFNSSQKMNDFLIKLKLHIRLKISLIL